MSYRYFDAHCHLNVAEFDKDISDVVMRMAEDQVGANVVGIDRQSSEYAIALAENNSHLYAIVGQHPTDTREEFDTDWYQQAITHPKVVGIGECGIDYFRTAPEDLPKERIRQEKLFRAQIALSLQENLPLMIHCRPSKGTMDAYEHGLDILEEYAQDQDNLVGNFHFYVGDKVTTERIINLGFAMSFTGVVTFTQDYDDSIRMIPSDAILVETDSPYVAPVPFRGKRCEPQYVVHIAEHIAKLRGESVESFALQLIHNTKKLFPKIIDNT